MQARATPSAQFVNGMSVLTQSIRVMNALITARFFDIRTATTTNRWLHWLLFCGVAGVPEQTYQAYSSATVLKAKIQLWGQPKQYMLGVLYHFTLCMPMIIT